MVNINKLRGKIIENGLSVKDLADNLDMDRSTLYRKMNSEGDTMTIRDAEKISKILNLSLEEVNSIFFSNFVA
ncbi:helix-turn-helix transcriptional regulator [uncultured Peptoniphilus sp.]|uniref:helix-turn-helix domain-containing protein n=1 Tax=uncultured Peptoniphilus sp. TaxID=254354 RepID=UPI0025944704|nr:helix-turn-helix transcriptional regulator [uncultured Peptoniphilus sp.]